MLVGPEILKRSYEIIKAWETAEAPPFLFIDIAPCPLLNVRIYNLRQCHRYIFDESSISQECLIPLQMTISGEMFSFSFCECSHRWTVSNSSPEGTGCGCQTLCLHSVRYSNRTENWIYARVMLISIKVLTSPESFSIE